MAETPKQFTKVRKFDDEEIGVIYRKAVHPLESGGQYPDLPYPSLLPSVTVVNGIRIERDIAVPLRDGNIIYTDIYRPVGMTNVAEVENLFFLGRSFLPLGRLRCGFPRV